MHHTGLNHFINRQYGCDEAGNWFVQNGPQRVFVALAYTPWIWRRQPDGRLLAHTGEEAGEAQAVFIDENGNLLIATRLGIGLLDDRDLAATLEECREADESPVSESTWLARLAGQPRVIFWRQLALQSLDYNTVPQRFGFNRQPAPT